MGTSTIFYLLSVLFSLYCAYLAAFRTYKMEYSVEAHDFYVKSWLLEKPEKKEGKKQD